MHSSVQYDRLKNEQRRSPIGWMAVADVDG